MFGTAAACKQAGLPQQFPWQPRQFPWQLRQLCGGCHGRRRQKDKMEASSHATRGKEPEVPPQRNIPIAIRSYAITSYGMYDMVWRAYCVITYIGMYILYVHTYHTYLWYDTYLCTHYHTLCRYIWYGIVPYSTTCTINLISLSPLYLDVCSKKEKRASQPREERKKNGNKRKEGSREEDRRQTGGKIWRRFWRKAKTPQPYTTQSSLVLFIHKVLH